MPPPVETEVKLRVADPGAAREALTRIGATLLRPRHFEDNVLFDDVASSLAAQGRLLRLRRTPQGAVLTFKGPRRIEGGIKKREEIETPVPDPDALEAILAGMGLRRLFRYQKYREVYAWRDAEIVVDETPVGTFLEIEGPAEAIHAAAAALGYARGDYIAASYAELFLAAGGRGDMVFK